MKNKGSNKEEEKEYTGSDLMEETMKILKEDNIGKKMSEAQRQALSKLLVKTVLKGEL